MKLLGDFSGLFVNADPLYEHTFIQLDVYISQEINGVWQQWPLVSDKLFEGKGSYVKPIRLLLSGQPYPANIVIRRPELGGGDLLCHVQVTCSSLAIGSDGRARVDFRSSDQGMFVGGVSLIGSSV
jgi:hypothetical protein